MSSTFLTRLRVGDKLVDTKGVSRLYRSGPSRRLMFLLVLARARHLRRDRAQLAADRAADRPPAAEARGHARGQLARRRYRSCSRLAITRSRSSPCSSRSGSACCSASRSARRASSRARAGTSRSRCAATSTRRARATPTCAASLRSGATTSARPTRRSSADLLPGLAGRGRRDGQAARRLHRRRSRTRSSRPGRRSSRSR